MFYLLLVGTGMLELLGWRALARQQLGEVRTCGMAARAPGQTMTQTWHAYLRPVGGWPDTEVFLELGREVLILKGCGLGLGLVNSTLGGNLWTRAVLGLRPRLPPN